MSDTKRINTIVQIGGALSSSVKKSFSFLSSRLDSVSKKIKGVKTRQKELEAQRKIYIKQGLAVDALDKEHQQLTNTLTKLNRKQKSFVTLSKNMRQVGPAFSNAIGGIRSLATTTAVAVGAVGGGIFALANSTATLGDNTAKTADSLGVNIERLQELRYAAERSGVASNVLDTSLQRMTRRLGDAAAGGGPAASALEELGLNAQSLANLPADEALQAIADKMQGLQSQSERVRIAFKLFDRQGVLLTNMLKDGGAGLRQLQKDARATGYVLGTDTARNAETFKDNLLDMQLSFLGLKNTIGSALIPVLSELFVKFGAWLKSNKELVAEFTKKFVKGFVEALPTFIQLGKGLLSLGKNIAGLFNSVASLVGGFNNLGVILTAVFAASKLVAVLALGKALIGVGVAVAAAFGPIGLIVAGLVAGAILIYNKWDAVKKIFSSIGETIKGVVSGVGRFFGIFDSKETTPENLNNGNINNITNTRQQDNNNNNNKLQDNLLFNNKKVIDFNLVAPKQQPEAPKQDNKQAKILYLTNTNKEQKSEKITEIIKPITQENKTLIQESKTEKITEAIKPVLTENKILTQEQTLIKEAEKETTNNNNFFASGATSTAPQKNILMLDKNLLKFNNQQQTTNNENNNILNQYKQETQKENQQKPQQTKNNINKNITNNITINATPEQDASAIIEELKKYQEEQNENNLLDAGAYNYG